jgi:predicted DNA-binding transcriptional regulator YafY
VNRLERLYAVTEAIRRRAPQPVSAASLADEFGVTRRTMERDLAALRASGVPLYGTDGRRGGQQLASRGGRVVFSLSAEEVTALLLAATVSAGMPYSDAGRTAINRLLDSLPDDTRVAVDELRHRLRATVGDGVRAAPRVQRTVEEAVRRNVVVNIGYEDRNGATTRRAVEPVGFYGGGTSWFLIGWCRLRADGRIFRLDRITTARLTREVAPVRDVDDTLGWVPEELVTPG